MASKSRPMLVVGVQPAPVCSIRSMIATSFGRPRGGREHRRGPAGSRAAKACARAVRSGRRMAASPPGSGMGARWPTRSTPRVGAEQQLATPDRCRRRRTRSRRTRSRGPARRPASVLGEQRREMRVVVLHSRGGDVAPRCLLRRPAAGQVRRVQVADDDFGLDALEGRQVATVRSSIARVSRFSVSPMCWLIHA